MIVKIKTFSGETLYLPEEDYLDELMYSYDEDYDDLDELMYSDRDEKVGLGIAGAGTAAALGGAGYGLYHGRKAVKAARELSGVAEGGNSNWQAFKKMAGKEGKEFRGWLDTAAKEVKETPALAEQANYKNAGIIRKGLKGARHGKIAALAGAGTALAGGGAYLYARNKRKNRK